MREVCFRLGLGSEEEEEQEENVKVTVPLLCRGCPIILINLKTPWSITGVLCTIDSRLLLGRQSPHCLLLS